VDKQVTTLGAQTNDRPAEDTGQPGQNKKATSVPVLWNERGPSCYFERRLCLAISWLSPSAVIGRHRTFSPASEPRKGTISNDDDR
jgi:hypothetical protein